jgi:hypothetical protein
VLRACEKAEIPLHTTATSAIAAKAKNATTKVLRDFIAKPSSKPIRLGPNQGSLTSREILAGGTRGQRAVQVKPLEQNNIRNSNSIDAHPFASAEIA